MPKEVKEITQQAEQMKAFVEGIPGGGAGAMPGMPSMPGVATGGDMAAQMAMPSEAQMQQMFAGMVAQGLDPSGMDPAQFMQFLTGPGAAMMGGPQPPTGPAAGFAGQGGGGSGFDQGGGPGGGGGGFGGRGRGKGGRRNW
jgi:pre-mRNA 3'-end-processing factor FIP1